MNVGSLSEMRRQNGAGTGWSSMTVHGAGMGLETYTGRAREGHTGCEATEWSSDSWIRCKVSESSGGSWRAVLTVEGRAGSLTEAWSVDVAGISEVVGLNVAAVGGGASVTVHGWSMGKTGYTGRGREGHTGCEATEWVSASAVRCRVGEGEGGTRRAVVTAGGRAGSVKETWSMNVGSLSVMRRQNGAGTGLASMTVHGAGMGLEAFTGLA